MRQAAPDRISFAANHLIDALRPNARFPEIHIYTEERDSFQGYEFPHEPYRRCAYALNKNLHSPQTIALKHGMSL
jgi:hypothetical protein